MIRFETEYAACKAKVTDVNKDRPVGQQRSTALIKECIYPATFHALCIVGDIEGASTVEKATTEKVKFWFETAYA